jgi:hypothetical protein
MPTAGDTCEIADYLRLIVVAFPPASARRSSGYACPVIACCCGDFPPLAEDPLAFVFGGGLSRDLALCRPGHGSRPGCPACSC